MIFLIIWLIGFFIAYYFLRKSARDYYEEEYGYFEVLLVIFYSIFFIVPLIVYISEKIEFKVPKPPKWL